MVNELNIPEGYQKTELGVFPKEWEIKTFKDIADKNVKWSITGGPFGSNLKVSDYTSDGIRIVQLQNIGDGNFNDEYKIYTSEKKANELLSCNIYPNEILLSKMGDPVARACFIPNKRHRYLMSSDGIRLVVDESRFVKKFIHDYINSIYFRKRAIDASIGSTRLRIGLQDLKKLLVIAPPLPEQQAIASALSDVDALITALEQLITKKRDIKQGVMQQLLTGKKRLPGFEGEWEVKKLGDCLTKNPDYGINAPSVPYSDNLPVYIRITDISEDGRFLPEKITSVDNINSNNYFLEKDDLVFARTGASTGKTYLYNPKNGKLVFAGFLIRVKVDSQKLDPRFLKSYTETTMYWNWVNIMSMRSGQPGINGNEFSQLSIPLPPLPEQQAIAQILSDMDTEIESLEQKRNKYKAIKQGMMQELLTGKTRLV